MALAYTQLDDLTTNAIFPGRVRNAVANRAKYIENLVGATSDQTYWARRVFIEGRRQQIAADLAPELVQDPAILQSTTGDGSDVTDAALQGAVNVICEKYL